MKYLNLILLTTTLLSCRMQAPDIEYNKLVTVASGENKSISTFQEQAVDFEYKLTFDSENVAPEIVILKNPDNGVLKNCSTSKDYELKCTYVPHNGFSGLDSIILSGKDGQFFSKDNSKISITVKKRGPSLSKISDQTVNENSSIRAIDANDNGKDVDLNGHKISYNCLNIDDVNKSSKNCTLIPGLLFDKSSGILSWTPSFEQAGLLNFEISASSDGRTESQNFSINVLNLNRAPVLNQVENIVSSFDKVVSNIDFNDGDDDFDIDGEKLTYSCLVNSKNCTEEKGVAFDNHNGILSFDKNSLESDLYNFSIIASDNELTDTSKFSLTIIRNKAPVIGADQNITILRDIQASFTINNATDDSLSSNLLKYEIVQSATKGKIDGCFVINNNALTCKYTPNSKVTGTDFFRYRAFDGHLYSKEATITFTIKDRGPKIDSIADQQVSEEQKISQIDINDNGDDKDQNNNVITYDCSVSINNSNSSCISINGLSFNKTTGVIDWMTNIDQSGTYRFTVNAHSDNLIDSASFSIIVNNKNRAPVINTIATITLTKGETTDLIDFNDGTDDKDIDGDTLTYFCTRNGKDCAETQEVSFDTTSGQFRFDTSMSNLDIENFQITSTDGSLSATTTFNVKIEHNLAPVIGENQNEALYMNSSISFLANIATDDNTALANLVYEIVDAPIHGQLTNCFQTKNIRACTYIPDSNFIGADKVTYKVIDEHKLESKTATINFNVSKDTLIGVEIFEQNEEKNLKGVDIVWVIDDSGSMSDEQSTLATNFSSFIDNFTQNNKIPDFQMAITTTDARERSESFIADQNGKQWELNSAAQIANKSKLISDFKTAVNVGIRGSGREKAIDSASYITAKHNTWFRGNDYLLVYILLTDEPEQSSNSTLDNTNLLKSFKDNGEKVKVYPIINKRVNTVRYDEIAAQTGGKVYDIYSSFSNVLSDLSTSIIEKLSSFMLKSEREILANTISVKVNGNKVDAKNSNNEVIWKYENNSIFFTVAPDHGVKVEVSYEYKVR